MPHPATWVLDTGCEGWTDRCIQAFTGAPRPTQAPTPAGCLPGLNASGLPHAGQGVGRCPAISGLSGNGQALGPV